MDIILSMNNNETVLVLPIPALPKITISGSNQSFDTLNGEINLIGKKSLKSIALSSFLPSRDYEFIRPGASSNPQEYINFIEKALDDEIPIRFIWIDDNEARLNIAATIEIFDYEPDNTGDLYYTLKLKEYRFV